MTDRVSKIVLRGDISDLQAKMIAAGKSVKDFGDKITSQDKNSQKFRQGLTSVGDAAGKMGLVAAAGLGAVIAASANFDSSMSKVKAATHESAQNMELLRAAALEAGKDTVFSATEAADAITAMSKAGVQSGDILHGGLNGALSLASAGELDVADAAEIAATAMNQFGLAGKDIPHIADLLAAGAGKAQGEVSDMANALKYVGPVAHQMGISIEQATGTIAELASKGIVGEQAGTSLRGMLTALTSPSKAAATEMDALGISLYDASGKFVGFDGVAQQLHDTMGNLTNAERDQALGRIFGNEQITAARILYAGGGADVNKWTTAVNDSGYAAETASTKMDNLAGDFENFKGSLETALIGSGSAAQNPLRTLVQGATDAVNAFNNLDGATKNTATALLAITAITGGGLWFAGKVITGIVETRTALASLGLTARLTEGSLASVGKAAIASAGIATGALIGVHALAAAIQRDGDLALPGVNELTNQLNDLATKGTAAALTKQFGDLGGAIDVLDHRAGITKFSVKFNSVFGVRDVAKDEATQRVQALDNALASMVSSGHADAAAAAIKNLAAAQGLSKADTTDLMGLLPGYRDALAGVDSKTGDAAAATGDLAGATDGATSSVQGNTTALKDNAKALQDTIKARAQLADDTISAFDAETAYQRALQEGADRAAEAADISSRIKDARSQGESERADLRGQLAGAKTSSERKRIQDEINKSTKDQAAAIADLRKQLTDYTPTLDKTTKAGQANRDIISDMVKAWNNLSEQEQNAPGKYHQAHEALVRQAEQFGLTRKEAERYIRRLKIDIPTRVQTRIELDKQKAEADLKAWLADIAAHGFRTPAQKRRDNRAANLLGLPGHADGGYISGPGTGTSDSIPAYLSNGEFVIRAAAVDRYGVDFMHALNRMKFAQGGYVDQRAQRTQTQRFAAGGYVAGGGMSGLSSGDVDRITNALLSRPQIHQTVMPHNYSEFRRQQDADQRAAEMGAVTFRAS